MKMKVEVRADSVHIEGYVNAVERDSKIINVLPIGQCVEQIRAGAFEQSLRDGEDVAILENHDINRKLGSVKEGNLKLYEDTIGLRAAADIYDNDIIDKARRGLIKGWSFGFVCRDEQIEKRADNVPRRIVKALELKEVSLIDGNMMPCYAGTLVEVRGAEPVEWRDSEAVVEIRAEAVENGVADEQNDTAADERAELDYSYYDAVMQMLELRYNPYHDPSNGRFTSGGGGGGGMLVVPKGQKGKGFYVAPDTLDKGEQALANGEYDKWVKSRQPKQLDEALIKRVNATNSLFYNAGDAVKRNYNAELNEIGTMNLTDVEKKTASQKIYDYSVAELQARQKVYGVDTTGPARGVSGSDKAFDKVLNIRNEHAGYMQSLRDTSKKRTMQAKKKEETDAAEKAIAKAMSNGDLEITINGKVYSRTNKKSGTWREGSVADNKAYKAFQKSQKSLPIAKHRSWDSLSAEEKQVYYTKN